MTMNATGWIGSNVPGAEQRALHTLLPAAVDERLDVRVVAELGLVDTALGADRQLQTDLRDHHADLAGRHLHPRELLHAEDRPQLEPQARHQQLRLVARLALEGDRVVVTELAEPEPLGHQPDLGRADRLDRFQQTDSTTRTTTIPTSTTTTIISPAFPRPRAVLKLFAKCNLERTGQTCPMRRNMSNLTSRDKK